MNASPALDQVTLAGVHVVLRPLAFEHVQQLATVAKLSWFDLMSASCIAPVDEESAHAYVEEALAGWQRGSYLPFAVFDAKTDALVGGTRFGAIDLAMGQIEIGWTWYVEEVRQTAVNPECKLLLMSYAFDILGVERLQLKTGHKNATSQAAIAKLGCLREGTLRHAVIDRAGDWRDTVYYSLLRDEWPTTREILTMRLAAFD